MIDSCHFTMKFTFFVRLGLPPVSTDIGGKGPVNGKSKSDDKKGVKKKK
jgi:hypothetical protein